MTVKEFVDSIDFVKTDKAVQQKIEINPSYYNWRFKFRSVVTRIKTIFSHPRLHIKTERNITLAGIASKVDSIGMNMTYKDPRLWKLKENSNQMSAEYVYATIFEDEIAIYENKFITLLIDMMYRQITLEIAALFNKVAKFDKLVFNRKLDLGNLNAIIEHSDFLNSIESFNPDLVKSDTMAINSAVPYLTTHKSNLIEVLQDLLDLRTRLVHLFESNFYKTCKKAGKMSIQSICPTNILLQDPDYNYCYLFFKELLVIQHKETLAEEESSILYVNFVLKKVIASFYKLGFRAANDNDLIYIRGKEGRYIFRNVLLKRGLFEVKVNCTEEDRITVDATIDYGKNKFIKDEDLPLRRQANYLLLLYPASKTSFANQTEMNEKFTEIITEKIDSFTCSNCYIITDMPDLRVPNTVLCSSTDYKLDVTIENMVHSFFIVTEGDSFIYSKKCPICGTMGVEYDKGDYNCLICNSLYSIMRIGKENNRKDLLWLKRAVRPYDTGMDADD